MLCCTGQHMVDLHEKIIFFDLAFFNHAEWPNLIKKIRLKTNGEVQVQQIPNKWPFLWWKIKTNFLMQMLKVILGVQIYPVYSVLEVLLVAPLVFKESN